MIQPISLTTQNKGSSFLGRESIRIIPGSLPTQLEKNIEKELGIEPTPVKVSKFANGETYVNIKEDMRGKDVYIMPNANKNDVNDNLMEVYLKADAAKLMGANKVIAVLPNLPYARQERKSEPGEPISAALNLSLLETSGVNEIIAADLHAPAIEGFGQDMLINKLDSLDEMANYFNNKFFKKDEPLKHDKLVVVSPDFGGTKRAGKLAKALGDCNTATIYKVRTEHNKAEAKELLGDVEGKVCIIYDDIIDTAGTMANAVELLKAKGATDVYVAACHGLFNGSAMEKLNNAGVKEIVVTNTEEKPQDDKIIQVDLAPKIAGKMLDISA